MPTTDVPPDVDSEPGLGRATSVAVLLGVGAAIIAGATIWLVLTDPVTLATSVESGEVTPLVRRIADVLFNALAGLLDYL